MNPIISNLLEQVKTNALQAAKTAGANTLQAAEKDTQDFLAKAIPRLERWLNQLLSNAITQQEFTDLLEDLKDLFLINALTVAGIAEIEVDKVRNTVLSIVTGVVQTGIKTLAK